MADVKVRKIGGGVVCIKHGGAIFNIPTKQLQKLTVRPAEGGGNEWFATYSTSTVPGTASEEIRIAEFSDKSASEKAQSEFYNIMSLSAWRWVKRAAYIFLALVCINGVLGAIAITPAPQPFAQNGNHNPSAALSQEPQAPYVFDPKFDRELPAAPTLSCAQK